jgi:hypothetical protein
MTYFFWRAMFIQASNFASIRYVETSEYRITKFFQVRLIKSTATGPSNYLANACTRSGSQRKIYRQLPRPSNCLQLL